MTYAPAEDSFLLEECVKHYRGKRALEIGVGSGVLVEELQRRFESVVGTDIDLDSLHGYSGNERVLLVCCDAASAFSDRVSFDLVISNPPYLPDDAGKKDTTVHGGPAGIEATIRFVMSALPHLSDEGRMLVVVSSLADTAALDRLIGKQKLKKKVLKERKLFYETLMVLELSLSHEPRGP